MDPARQVSRCFPHVPNLAMAQYSAMIVPLLWSMSVSRCTHCRLLSLSESELFYLQCHERPRFVLQFFFLDLARFSSPFLFTLPLSHPPHLSLLSILPPLLLSRSRFRTPS